MFVSKSIALAVSIEATTIPTGEKVGIVTGAKEICSEGSMLTLGAEVDGRELMDGSSDGSSDGRALAEGLADGSTLIDGIILGR